MASFRFIPACLVVGRKAELCAAAMAASASAFVVHCLHSCVALLALIPLFGISLTGSSVKRYKLHERLP